MGTIPKTCWALCSQCHKHQATERHSPRSTRSLSILQGKKSYDRKKAKTTKKISQRLECTEPNCRSKRILAIKRYMHFELRGHKKRKIQSDSVLSFLFCFITKRIKS
ncbi:hypothetical protein FD755_004977 [Muntiacus reevesi]|uniref:Uncharacterized protein n=1 Tax=Muntiacus reevesi TaxID=9886 RepID=A0A5J5MS25_MUNRE|nr:hypothetical protein FD755_004977 [Muntiacus reevesi]